MNSEKTTLVRQTNNYMKFQILKGNRNVGQSRVNKIIASINRVGYITNPIIVNEHMEVIDGQGRLEALKTLQLPVDYIVVPGAGIDECISMNINQERWTMSDYIKSFAERGNENYRTLQKAIDQFAPGIAIRIVISVCSGNLSYADAKAIQEGDFEMGRWDWESVLEYMNKYTPYKRFVGGNWNNVMKVVQWVYDSKKVDRNVMYEQFAKYGRTVIGCVADTTDALESLETVYNYRKRGHVYFKQAYEEDVEARAPRKEFIHRKERK